MRSIIKISLGLNLLLLAALVFALANARKPAGQPPTEAASRAATDAVTIAAAPAPSVPEPEPFRWNQLQSQTNYRAFVANLRAIGCPETTIQDIVRGETGRAFAWERRQLGLDESGTGTWSVASERRLVASLLVVSSTSAVSLPGLADGAEATGESGPNPTTTSVPSQPGTIPPNGGGMATASSAPAAYPLFLQNVNWSALGFNPEQEAAIGAARQLFQNEVNGQSQTQGNPTSSGTSAGLSRWQTALQNANEQLRNELGGQAYAAYEQQQYYSWFQPQVIANAGGGNLNVNPDAFTVK